MILGGSASELRERATHVQDICPQVVCAAVGLRFVVWRRALAQEPKLRRLAQGMPRRRLGHRPLQRDRAERVRSPRPAAQDPLYRQLAESLQARTLVAHVRQASMGNVAERNCHPFVYGRWMFAHNGTVVGFPAVREELRASLPTRFREHIQGDTDSEHAFFLILTRLEQMLGTLGGAGARSKCSAKLLPPPFGRWKSAAPARVIEPSRFNFVLTDGQSLVASRWGHTLFWQKIAFNGAEAVHVASEPTMAGQWLEVPERSFYLRGCGAWIAVSGGRKANVAME